MENSFQIGFALFFGGSLLGLTAFALNTLNSIRAFRSHVRVHRLPEMTEAVWTAEVSTAQ